MRVHVKKATLFVVAVYAILSAAALLEYAVAGVLAFGVFCQMCLYSLIMQKLQRTAAGSSSSTAERLQRAVREQASEHAAAAYISSRHE